MPLRSLIRKWRHKACHCTGSCFCKDHEQDTNEDSDLETARIPIGPPTGPPIMLQSDPPPSTQRPRTTTKTRRSRESDRNRKLQETSKWRDRVNHSTMDPKIMNQSFLAMNEPQTRSEARPEAQPPNEASVYFDAVESFGQTSPPALHSGPESTIDTVTTRSFRDRFRARTHRISNRSSRGYRASTYSASAHSDDRFSSTTRYHTAPDGPHA